MVKNESVFYIDASKSILASAVIEQRYRLWGHRFPGYRFSGLKFPANWSDYRINMHQEKIVS